MGPFLFTGVVHQDRTSFDKIAQRYGVRETIRHAVGLVFTSDTHDPVLMWGAGDTAELILTLADRTPRSQPLFSGIEDKAR